MTTNRRNQLAPALFLGLGIVLAACSGAAAPPSPTPTATSAPSAPAPSPGEDEGSTEPGGSGGAGVTDPDAPVEGGGGMPGNPGGVPGQPQVVVPKPGQQMVHEVEISELVAQVDGRKVLLNARFWSGVEPCSVLDSVDVTREGTTFTVRLNEGTSDPAAMCVMLAVEKVVVIDLGELDSGSYTVKASTGDAAPIEVVVP